MVTYLTTTFSYGNVSAHNATVASHSKSITGRNTNCTTIQMQPGDSYALLAIECGISAADFIKYNPGSRVPGQYVCCSAGALPDFSLKPDLKGNCYSYLVKTGDSCSSLAAAYDIVSNNVIESYNKNTWGWNGC